MQTKIRTRIDHLLWVWGWVALVACGESQPADTGGSTSVAALGDTVVVTSQRPPTLDTAHMEMVARIGRFDGPDDFLLTGVESFAVGARGEVYVADDGIKVFSPDGSTVRQIARTGQGPGEVRTVIGMAVDDLGRLLASDLGNRRIAVYDTSGTILDHWRLPYGRPVYGRPAVVPIGNGQVLVGLNPAIDRSVGPQGGFPRPIFLRLDRTGTVLDTVLAPARMGEKCQTLDDPVFSRGYWQDIREPLVPKLKWTAGTSGEVVLGCPTDYVVDRVQADGTVLRFSHLREPVIEPPEVRKSYVEHQKPWSGLPPPEVKPYFHRLNVGRGGRLWVWPGHPREKHHFPGPPSTTYWSDPRVGTFDVFDAEGRFLGPVLLPPGVQYHWHPGYEEPFFAGDTAWLVRRDSLDVEYVDRMKIIW